MKARLRINAIFVEAEGSSEFVAAALRAALRAALAPRRESGRSSPAAPARRPSRVIDVELVERPLLNKGGR